MSNARKGKRSLKPKSEFQTEMDNSAKKAFDSSLTEEKRKELRYRKLDEYFKELGDKTNRYFFYCPDIPFPCSLVKTTYQHAYQLTKLGYNAVVMHENKGFKPEWLQYEWVKEVKTTSLTQGQGKQGHHRATFNFTPTDSVIIPEGFWSTMEAFADIKQVHKIVLAHGYGGIITTQPGANWAYLGFTDVICVSEKLKSDYEKLWPMMNYHVIPYIIDQKEFEPLPTKEIFPAIALSARSREDAQSLINIFKNRYPFLSMFDFRIMKKHNTEAYVDVLRHCALQVLVDEKAGHPATPLEAISCGVPTIAVYGRGYEHLAEQEGMIFVTNNDLFELAEAIAHFCLSWLDNPTVSIADKTILENYTEVKCQQALTSTFAKLQSSKVQLFSAIKQAVDAGKLDDHDLISQEDIKAELAKQEDESTEVEEVATADEGPFEGPTESGNLKIVE